MSEDVITSNPFRKSILAASSQPAAAQFTQADSDADDIFTFAVDAPPTDRDNSASFEHPRHSASQQESVIKTVRVVSPPPGLSVSYATARERDPTQIDQSQNGIEISVESSNGSSDEEDAADPFIRQGEAEDGGNAVTGHASQNYGQSSPHEVRHEPGARKNLISPSSGKIEGHQRFMIDSSETLHSTKRNAIPGPSPLHTKSAMDVDAFTRMLLTGSSASGTSKTISIGSTAFQQAPTILGDSSSGTDVSSISRQSVFEYSHEAQQETPRTSHEINRSDEEIQRDSADSPKANRKKPPPPKPRHGKLLSNSRHRTGSLESDETPARPSLDAGIVREEVLSSSGDDQATQTISRRPPLSTPPVAPLQSAFSSIAEEVKPRSERMDHDDIPVSSTLRIPPTPPQSRKHNQVSRSPAVETASVDAGNPSPLSTSLGRAPSVKAPPPPPSRRSLAGHSHSSTSSTDRINEPSALHAEGQTTHGSLQRTQSKSSKPIPPPARSNSISSIKRLSQSPNASFPLSASPSSSMAPPPPPPRRRGSSKSSLDTIGRIESSRRDSRASIEATWQGTSEAGEEDKDVLADISALQREVDELRGKYQRSTK